MNKNEIGMNLYIVKEVLCDYTSGMVVIAAPTLERARELHLEEFGEGANTVDEFDTAIKCEWYTVLQVVDQPEGVVSYVYGGG